MVYYVLFWKKDIFPQNFIWRKCVEKMSSESGSTCSSKSSGSVEKHPDGIGTFLLLSAYYFFLRKKATRNDDDTEYNDSPGSYICFSNMHTYNGIDIYIVAGAVKK